jgi:hypothetical protein
MDNAAAASLSNVRQYIRQFASLLFLLGIAHRQV